MYGRLIFGSNLQLTSSNFGARSDLKAQLQVADATEKLLKDPQVAGVRDVKLRITTLRRRARIVYLPAYVVDYNFGSRFNAHGERTPERFQAVISGMGELLCCVMLAASFKLPKQSCRMQCLILYRKVISVSGMHKYLHHSECFQNNFEAESAVQCQYGLSMHGQKCTTRYWTKNKT